MAGENARKEVRDIRVVDPREATGTRPRVGGKDRCERAVADEELCGLESDAAERLASLRE